MSPAPSNKLLHITNSVTTMVAPSAEYKSHRCWQQTDNVVT